MSRKERNRLESIALPGVAEVDLGRVTVREARTVMEALVGQARAYGKHPRAGGSTAVAAKLRGAIETSWAEQLAAKDQHPFQEGPDGRCSECEQPLEAVRHWTKEERYVPVVAIAEAVSA